MAKKKRGGTKTRRKSSRRGRRVSGISGIEMNDLVAVGAGAVGSKALNGVLKNVKFINDKPILRPIVKLGLGYMLMSWKGAGNFGQNAAMGIMAEATLDLLGVAAPNVFAKLAGDPPISGYNMIDLDEVKGYNNVDTGVAGYKNVDTGVAGYN